MRMEVQASRGEMVARMRQNRIQQLMSRLEEEGIPAGEEPTQIRTVKRQIQPQERDRQPTVAGRADKAERMQFQFPPNLGMRLDRSTSPRQQQEEEEEEPTQAAEDNFDEEARQLSVTPSTAYHQVKFYDDALETQKRKLIIEHVAKQDVLNKANSKKINRKSEKILQEKLEQNLMMAIISACPEAEDLVTYEKLGRVLYLLGLFSVVKFDEQCQVRFSPDSTDRNMGVQKYHDVGARDADDVPRAALGAPGLRRPRTARRRPARCGAAVPARPHARARPPQARGNRSLHGE